MIEREEILNERLIHGADATSHAHLAGKLAIGYHWIWSPVRAGRDFQLEMDMGSQWS